MRFLSIYLPSPLLARLPAIVSALLLGSAFCGTSAMSAGLSAFPRSEKEIQLAWEDPEPSASLAIQRRTNRNGAWQTITNTPFTGSYLDTNVSSDTLYEYRLAAPGQASPTPGALACAQTDDRKRGIRTLRFQQGVNGYSKSLGLGISQRKPRLSNDSELVPVATEEEGAGENQALLRFDGIFGPEPHRVPQGTKIHSAALRIFVPSGRDAWSRNRVYFFPMLQPWNEGASWNSPSWGGDGIQPGGTETKAEASAQIAFSNPGSYYTLDVTPAVQAWSEGEDNNGWLLVNRMADSYGFLTPQTAVISERPELIVRFDTDQANHAPTITAMSASRNAEGTMLEARVDDEEGDPLELVFRARRRATGEEDFKVIVLPDTQYYVAGKHGGTPDMLKKQVAWVVENANALNIAFVLHLGDIVDHGDRYHQEWKHASSALYQLDNSKTTGRPQGIPFAVCVGNHDQTPNGQFHGTTGYFNRYFGTAYFQHKPGYGANFGDTNNSHYQRFQAGGLKFLVLSLEYGRPRKDSQLLNWAEEVLRKHPDHRTIVLTHYTMEPGPQGPLSPDGAAIYRRLRECPNLMMILGGHITGEGHRVDRYQGRLVHSLVQDFQFDGKGGAGFLGMLTFSPRTNQIRVQTYSPLLNEWRRDPGSDYILHCDLGAKVDEFVEIKRTRVKAGSTARLLWAPLNASDEYEWLVEASDGAKHTRSSTSTIPVLGKP